MVKNCTTIEQSKKLLKLGLNPETADVVISYDKDRSGIWDVNLRESLEEENINDGEDFLSWSLSALLNVLPRMLHGNCIQIVTSAALWHVGYYSEHVERSADLLDAIFNMVVWLLENNYIKTEKV